jgi:WD40 repeat protein
MTDLKTLIDKLDAPDDWDSIVRRWPSRSLPEVVAPRTIRNDRIRRAATAVAAMGMAAFAIFFLIRAFETSPPPGPRQVQPVVRTFELAAGVGHMDYAFGSLWVVGDDGVIRIDPTTGEVVAEIPVDGITSLGDSGAKDWSWITSGAGRVWVTAEPDIVGIDPARNEITQRFTYESAVSRLTFTDGLIVAGGSAEGNGDIRLIDPRTETYVEGGGLAAPLAGGPSVLVTRDWYWAGGETHEGGAALVRNSKDGSTQEAIQGIESFDSFAAAGGFVWVTGGDRLYRVDDTYDGPAPSPQSVFPVETDAVSAEIAIEGLAQVASDGARLWLLEGTEDGSSSLTEIDPVTGEDRSAPVMLAGDGPAEVAVAGGDAWVSFRNSGLLIQAERAGEPPLSPSIAFSAYSGGHWQIFSMKADGSAVSQLTALSTDQFHPAWAPDGTRIAFSAQGVGGKMAIHVMDADGSDVQQLTEGPGWSYRPAWSPDGSRIVFVSNRDGNDEIYVMDADGSNQTRLTDDPDEDQAPVWSPDGTRILFQSNRRAGNEIFVMSPEGTAIRNLTDIPGAGAFDPAWSPDGSRIAFVSDRDGNPEIYLMNADGSGIVRLTNDPAHDWSPDWSTDGSRIAYESDRDGAIALYAVGLDGEEPVRLTDTGGDTCCPTWRPARQPS